MAAYLYQLAPFHPRGLRPLGTGQLTRLRGTPSDEWAVMQPFQVQLGLV
ncbi:hypothetical protein [Streptomyces sp. NBC_01285]|nr:hypothetical protein [Streptomyces sp. NBC_01285]MCX4768194.1 hypothetical protein [Streptomyces sp. NBC_01285]